MLINLVQTTNLQQLKHENQNKVNDEQCGTNGIDKNSENHRRTKQWQMNDVKEKPDRNEIKHENTQLQTVEAATHT